MMDLGRLARESRVLLGVAGLIAIGILRDQVSLMVVLVAVVGSLWVGWGGVRATVRER